MAKYSCEFKRKMVLEYLNTSKSYDSVSQKYGIPSSLLKIWTAAYQKLGDNGLKRSRAQKIYSFKEKFSVVKSYLTSEISYQKLVLQVGINNPAMIARWVNEFKAAGPDALRSHKKGRKKMLSKPQARKTKSQLQQPTVDTDAGYVRELENELLKLRIENAFLKEMRRLRLEDEAKLRELQKLSAVSEDNSN